MRMLLGLGIVLSLSLAGCVQEETPEGHYRVDIRTAYYDPAPYYEEENDRWGLDPGDPARNAGFSFRVILPAGERCIGGIPDITNGEKLPALRCTYNAKLGPDGAINFFLPKDADVELTMGVGGKTPTQPPDCPRFYSSSVPPDWEEFEADPTKDPTIVLPFYIKCQKALD